MHIRIYLLPEDLKVLFSIDKKKAQFQLKLQLQLSLDLL